MSWDQYILMGRIGNEVELRTTPGGKHVLNLNIAKNKYDGSTIWVKCVAWDKNAENIAKYFKQGRPIMVVGSLEEPDTWIDKEGNAQARNVLNINTWTFTESSKEADGEGTKSAPKSSGGKQRKSEPKEDVIDLDAIINAEEIPF